MRWDISVYAVKAWSWVIIHNYLVQHRYILASNIIVIVTYIFLLLALIIKMQTLLWFIWVTTYCKKLTYCHCNNSLFSLLGMKTVDGQNVVIVSLIVSISCHLWPCQVSLRCIRGNQYLLYMYIKHCSIIHKVGESLQLGHPHNYWMTLPVLSKLYQGQI